MPRVLHAIDTTGPGGAETVFVSLAEHFSRPPYQSIAMIRGAGWVKSQLDARGIPVIVEESKGSVNLAYLRRFTGHLKNNGIDLVHAHLPGANLYGAMAGRIRGIPVISTFHGSVDVQSRGRMDAIKHQIVRRWSRVVAVSAPLQEELAGILSVPLEEVTLIPNGIDCRKFAEAEPLGLREQFNLSAKTVVVGSLGNIRPAKAYDVGLRAFKALRDSGVDAHWFVAGQDRPGDSLLDELRSLAAKLGIEHHVSFLGFVDRPERFLSDLDVYLLCSSSEGHPLALTQAMAAGKPIVATRCGVEVLFEGETHAWLAAVGDFAGLAAHIRSIASDHAKAAVRTANARSFARNHYDFSAALARYDKLYSDLLRRVY